MVLSFNSSTRWGWSSTSNTGQCDTTSIKIRIQLAKRRKRREGREERERRKRGGRGGRGERVTWYVYIIFTFFILRLFLCLLNSLWYSSSVNTGFLSVGVASSSDENSKSPSLQHSSNILLIVYQQWHYHVTSYFLYLDSVLLQTPPLLLFLMSLLLS